MHAPLHLAFLLAGWLLALAAFPLFADLAVLSIAALFPVRRPQRFDPTRFALAVIIPAHNEELLITSCVESLLASPHPASPGPDMTVPDMQVFVVAHNCTDATAERAAAAGANVLVLNDEVGGKGTALHHAFTHVLALGAQGVLVIDADSTVSPNLASAVASRLAGGTPALQCRYQVANAETNTRTRLAALAFLGINVLRPRGRDRLGLSSGIFGNGFALAASTLRAVPYTANSLVEDLEYHLHLIAHGMRVEFVDHATVFGEMPESGAASTTQRARWEGGRILMRRRWSMPLLVEVARGDLRLLEPLLDLLALPLATEAALLCAVTLLAWLAASTALGLYGIAGLLTMLLYVLAAASLAPAPMRALAALAGAPAYMFWKLLMIPRTRLTARSGTAWVRTKRNTEGK